MEKMMSEDILKILEGSSSGNEDSTSCVLKAATFLADIVYPDVLNRLHGLKNEDRFHVICDYDGFDITISDDKDRIRSEKIADLDLFSKYLPHVDVEIKISWHQTDNDIFDVDGCLLTVDDQEFEATGLIYIEAHLPSDLSVVKKTIKSLRQEIISVLVHEFRHATQKYIWGWSLPEASSLTEHMTAISEIDARVEEICCYSSKGANAVSKEEFRSLSLKYMKRYLLRNAKELEINEFNDMCERLVDTHMMHFSKRLKVSEFIEPQ
jgi:hypothetical protein